MTDSRDAARNESKMWLGQTRSWQRVAEGNPETEAERHRVAQIAAKHAPSPPEGQAPEGGERATIEQVTASEVRKDDEVFNGLITKPWRTVEVTHAAGASKRNPAGMHVSLYFTDKSVERFKPHHPVIVRRPASPPVAESAPEGGEDPEARDVHLRGIRCPACGGETLTAYDGDGLTCRLIGCPAPLAASRALVAAARPASPPVEGEARHYSGFTSQQLYDRAIEAEAECGRGESTLVEIIDALDDLGARPEVSDAPGIIDAIRALLGAEGEALELGRILGALDRELVWLRSHTRENHGPEGALLREARDRLDVVAQRLVAYESAVRVSHLASPSSGESEG